MERRKFLFMSLFLPTLVFSKPYNQKRLKLQTINNGKKLSIVYFENGEYIDSALSEINYFLRDRRTNEVCDIDTNLLDLLYKLQKKKHTKILSGFRSASTNEMLRHTTKGVAKHSLHTEGQAVDVYLGSKKKVKKFSKKAKKLKMGGVGTYYGNKFVHIDVGRVRHWTMA